MLTTVLGPWRYMEERGVCACCLMELTDQRIREMVKVLQ